jgi:hypothetical protein
VPRRRILGTPFAKSCIKSLPYGQRTAYTPARLARDRHNI